MKYHYDVTGAEAILRDIPVYHTAAIAYGTPMASGAVATGVMGGRATPAAAAVCSNIIGVTNEDVSAADALAVLATGVENYAKHIINPGTVWLAKYSKLAADDVVATGLDATGKTLTSADSGVANQLGAWCYITNVGSTTDGFGNLFCTGAVTGTTVMTAVTDYDDSLSANAVGDTYIGLHPRYGSTVVGGCINLATNLVDLQGIVAAGGSAAITVLENHIGSSVRPLEPLVISTHSGYNYASEDPDFYADIHFDEHLLNCGGVVNDRVIT